MDKKIIAFSSKVTRRNRTSQVVGIPKKTSEANPELKHGMPVNVKIEFSTNQ